MSEKSSSSLESYQVIVIQVVLHTKKFKRGCGVVGQYYPTYNIATPYITSRQVSILEHQASVAQHVICLRDLREPYAREIRR